MCEFCSGNAKNLHEDRSPEEDVFLWVEQGQIRLEVYSNMWGNSTVSAADVNYCPMCGRKLI